MSGREESGEKTHEPTPKKLEDARKKGDIAKSTEVSVASAYAGFILAGFLVGAAGIADAAQTLSIFLGRADQLTGHLLGPGGRSTAAELLFQFFLHLAPIFAFPFVGALAALLAQRAFVVSAEKLAPKASRISPISNAKNKYGPTGLMEFAKSFTKLLTISAVAYFILATEISTIVGSARAGPAALVGLLFALFVRLLIGVAIIAAAIAFVDLVWQRFDHARKLRMSYQEIKDEQKEIEGDPHFKSKRRQRAQEIVGGQMLSDTAEADVVIVNPTHVSVALKWSRQKGSAPVCVAKGVDEVALRIREIASEAGVPIHRDVPTARALVDLVEIGAEIPEKHYRAVAAAIRFADDMRAKMRARGWTPGNQGP